MARKQLTKEYIAKSLLILMKNKNYNNITIEEITNKAGVNRSTYYRNFDSKESIIEFFLDEIMSNYIADYAKLQTNSMETYLYTIFKHFYYYKNELLLIYKSGLSYILLNVLNNRFNEIYNLKEINPELQYKLYYHIGGIYNNYILWFSHDMKETPEQLVDIIYSANKSSLTPYLFKQNI